MSEPGPLDQLVHRACRRSLWHLILAQAALAASVAMAGLVVLLLVGTQILDWPWIAVLFVVSFSFGLFRTLRRIPVPYLVAQGMDRRLRLQDSLSTAFYFRHLASGRRCSGDIREGQQRQAEHISRQVDIRQAIPLGFPRSFHLAALLGLVACGLFGLRYGVNRSLDLRPPLARALVAVFQPPAYEQAALDRKSPRVRRPELPAAEGLDLDQAEGRDTLPADAAAESGSSTGNSRDAASESSAARQPAQTRSEQEGEESDSSAGQPDPQSAASSSPPGDRKTDQPPPPRAKPPSAASSDDSSLMNKLRDAMADLLSRLKIQPPPGDSQQSASSRESGLRSRSERKPGGQGEPSEGRRQAEQTSGGEQQAGQQGQDAQTAKGTQADSGDRSSEARASRQERSGVGREEGSKALREAEQLAAMGKISEIIGKRSSQVAGEVMVEVASGKQQQLKTPYSQSGATHSEAGSEIHRDEVPLIFQPYVQRYFEQVRK